MTRTGWGHKVEYARAIADDTAQITHLNDPRVVRLCEIVSEIAALPQHINAHPELWTLPQLASVHADVAAVMGYSTDDLRAMHVTSGDIWGRELFGEEQAGDRARGQALWAALGEFPLYRADVRAERLRKAKIDLSRHKRNQAKYKQSA